MLGAIIGDIVGSAYEFSPTFDYQFDLLTSGSNFTDDTICTIAVADAILNNKPYKQTVHEWCRKYPNPQGGYGGSFLQWVRSDDPQPYNSFGNGSAMRVSPIGWLFNNEEDVLREAEKSAIVSHNHPEGIKGAQAIAYAVWYARNNRGMALSDIVCDIAMKFDYSFDTEILNYQGKFDETCQGTIPAALSVLYRARNFEDAIRLAVSLGADADTLGAIVGSVAEAYFGIPGDLYMHALDYITKEMGDVLCEFLIKINKV